VIVVVVDPIDVDHSMITTYTLVTPEFAEAALVAAAELDDAGTEPTLLQRGALEDNEMSVGVQRGLRSGANAFVEFGRHESAIGHFHANLDERLALLAEVSGAESRP
jgi:choline monooxygenase